MLFPYRRWRPAVSADGTCPDTAARRSGCRRGPGSFASTSGAGRLEWSREPDQGQWEYAFEGTPVSDGRHAYVCLRRGGVYPECHVECLDVADGHTIWRRFVCAGRHATGGNVVRSHNLLTLVGDTLYLNTNMGAVAALTTDAGQLRWVRQYADVHDGAAKNANGDPSPCLVSQGRVFVAPDDSDLVMAVDAQDGRLLWHVATRGEITDLLGFRSGVKGGELIASGRRLWCLDEASGSAVWRWPPGSDEVHAAGRGFVLDGDVYWPTSDNSIRVFRQGGRDGYWPSQIRLPIIPGQAYAGDLLAAGDILLVTSENRLLAFGGDRSAADDLPTSPNAKTSRQPSAAAKQTR
ncbi:MAG: PQQ-binding-like beta-propeller repeat protein [Pirellulales bacterium]